MQFRDIVVLIFCAMNICCFLYLVGLSKKLDKREKERPKGEQKTEIAVPEWEDPQIPKEIPHKVCRKKNLSKEEQLINMLLYSGENQLERTEEEEDEE